MTYSQLKVELEWSFLQRIAEYYEFPSAVFLGNKKVFRTKTRSQALKKKAQLFDKIKELVEQDD